MTAIGRTMRMAAAAITADVIVSAVRLRLCPASSRRHIITARRHDTGKPHSHP